jgi:lysozyme
MQMTEEGLALIRRFEGFRAEAYRCPAGVWTIGYGHTSQAGAPKVRPGMVVSEAEAREILAVDAAMFAEGVRTALTREVSPQQFSALVSFAYNVGIGAFRRSSVLKAVNEGRFEAVPERLKLWVKADGRRLEGLARRRQAEAELFATVPAVTKMQERGGLIGLLIALIRFIARRLRRS